MACAGKEKMLGGGYEPKRERASLWGERYFAVWQYLDAM